MNITAVIKSMDFRQLWSLFWLCIRHLRFVIPTLKGTRKTVTICDQKYGKKHHRNGPENAVRHALWNILIIHHSVERGLSISRSLAWAKTITDWHEDFSPNEPLAKVMDLHNNKEGRTIYKTFPRRTEDFYLTQVMERLPLSRKRTKVDQIAADQGFFVHIENTF